MPKKRSEAQAFVTDGAGGMVPVEDHRFDEGPWFFVSEVPAARADEWMEYLYAECADRGWQCSSFGQMDADENSGNITVRTGAPGQSPEVVIVWERPRNGPLQLRTRITGEPQPPDDQAKAFIGRVDERFRAGVKQAFYRRGYLHYRGLPWSGELWLDDDVRLGPPAQQARGLIADRIVVVDTIVRAIGQLGASNAAMSKLEEISFFLTVAMRDDIRLPQGGYAWTIDTGKRQSELRQLGYQEENVPSEMPDRGQHPPVPLREVARPDFDPHFISTEVSQQWVPADIQDLWRRYISLAQDRRDQFQRVARIIQTAHSLSRENRTASLALRVVACEALKPPGRKYDSLNIYDVVGEVLGPRYVRQLRGLRFPPQKVRSAHLHRGEVLDVENIHRYMMRSTFWDPTFDQECRVVAQVTDAAIIEWLRSGGTFAVVRRARPRRKR